MSNEQARISAAWRPYATEAAAWWAVTWPSALRGVTELLPWLCTLVVVGRALGSDELAALSLAETFGYPLMVVTWGATGVTATALVSQAHGARSTVAVRGWLVIAVSVCLGMSVAVAAKVAVAPAFTDWLAGWVVMVGAATVAPVITIVMLSVWL